MSKEVTQPNYVELKDLSQEENNMVAGAILEQAIKNCQIIKCDNGKDFILELFGNTYYIMETEQIKTPTTIQDVINVISDFAADNNHNVSFIGGFTLFDENSDEITDDRIFGYGPKKVVECELEGIEQVLKDETEDFINW